MRVLGRCHWIGLALWAVCVGQLVAQDASLPRPRANDVAQPGMPEVLPQPPPYLPGPTDSGPPTTLVPNSGYAGADSQWNRMNYIGETPTHDDPAPCIGDGCRDSDFTPFALTSQGVCILNRSRAHSGSLSTDILPVLGRHSVFSSGDLPFQVAPGYDEVVEGYLGRDANNYDWSIQGGFRGLNEWVASGAVYATTRITETTSQGIITHGGLNSFFNGELIGLDWADRHTAHYASGFDTAEINFVLRPHPRSDRAVLYPNGRWYRERETGVDWSFLAGARVLSMDEGFTFRGTGSYTRNVGGVISQGQTSGMYFAHTSNEMIGLQVGTAVTLREQYWDLALHFKAAPMINSALSESRFDTTDPLFGDRHATFRFFSTRVAALLEVGVQGTWRLSEEWALRAGYDVSWLPGAALAPVQRPSFNQANTDATLFLQGLILAVEYRR